MSAHDPTSDLDCERNIIRECAGALAVRREPPPCAHCHHVTRLQTQLGVAKWLIGIAPGATLTVLARDLVSYVGLRVKLIPPPSSSAERTTIDRVER
jgi:hypothetical protein